MDDDVLDDQLQTDADSFAEWIEQVADSRGVSEDELLHQLMSSYWMMDELASVIDELDIDAGRGEMGLAADAESQPDEPVERKQDPSEQEEARRSQPETLATGEHDEGVIALIETLKDWKTERETPESSAVDENLIDLIRVIQEGNQTASTSGQAAGAKQAGSTDAGGVNETVQLIRALKEFNEPSEGSANVREQLEAETRHRELAGRIDELESEIQTVTRDLQQVDRTAQERASQVADELQQVAARLDSIEKAVQNKPDSHTVDKLEDAVNDIADDVTSVRSQVDSRFDEVDADFDNVERILTHLFDQLDENSSETDDLADQLASMQTRMEVLDELEAAGDLQRKASRAGITAADCGSCGESVEVGQLSKPECPYCNTAFEDLESGKKWGLFSHHTLTVENADPEHHPH